MTPTETQLSALIRQQVTASVQHAFARKADVMAEEMAQELLRDPDTRVQFTALVRAAFEQALVALGGTNEDGGR